ncbi:MAG: ferredoxin [Bacteroidota bacterium]|nr:ferredoxin [Bacteroidota bacterium]
MLATSFKSGNQLSASSIRAWRIAQALVWLVGATIFGCLLFFPALGLLLFWNVLIPVAPALMVISVGLWRNVCPLATTNLLPRHFNLSRKKKMPVRLQSKLGLVAVIALYLIVPLRHAVLNNSGIATATLLLVAVTIGMSMGFVYDWKSAWCSTLCPVHPVERMYGANTLMALPNAHCDSCVNCSIPCPDSTPNFNPAVPQKNNYQKLSGFLIVGGLPGFIWGWFHVPDTLEINSVREIISAYTMPFAGCILSLTLYWMLLNWENKRAGNRVVKIFAASAVSMYYWYRIPALLGFGLFAKDGQVVDLSSVLPQWSTTLMTIAAVLFFFYWVVIRKSNHQSWVVRPAYATRQSSLSRQKVDR